LYRPKKFPEKRAINQTSDLKMKGIQEGGKKPPPKK